MQTLPLPAVSKAAATTGINTGTGIGIGTGIGVGISDTVVAAAAADARSNERDMWRTADRDEHLPHSHPQPQSHHQHQYRALPSGAGGLLLRALTARLPTWLAMGRRRPRADATTANASASASTPASAATAASIDEEAGAFSPSTPANDVDMIPPETDDATTNAQQRFRYTPTSLLQRVLVSARVHNRLNGSRILRIPPPHPSSRYALLLLLVIFTVVLTPQLLPRWAGFEWATAAAAMSGDLCQAAEEKLAVIRERLRREAQADEAGRFLTRQLFDLACVNASAADFYHGSAGSPPRFQWPHECTSDKAQGSLRERHCQAQDANVCAAVGGFLGFLTSLGGNCVRQVGPEVCVDTNNADRADALLQLEQQRAKLIMPSSDSDMLPPNATGNDTNMTTPHAETFTTTANQRVQGMVARVISQIDIAADAFIVYSMVAIAVGVPLAIYRREKGSAVVGAALGLTKIWFIVLFVVAMSVFDSAAIIVKETDFARLFRNFLEDPCYVDPAFSAERARLITDVCNDVNSVAAQSAVVTQRLDALYYDVRLFGYCKDDARGLAEHPRLSEIDALRQAYRNGTLTSPGICNATRLNELSSVAPNDDGDGDGDGDGENTKNVNGDDELPKWHALLASGVLAQLLLKFVLTGWVMHVFAYLQPMVLHNGKVEVWGTDEGSDLTPDEEDAVRRFARDKHLLPLVFFSLLLALEAVLIVYSIVTLVQGGQEIDVNNLPPPIHPNETLSLQCSKSLFE